VEAKGLEEGSRSTWQRNSGQSPSAIAQARLRQKPQPMQSPVVAVVHSQSAVTYRIPKAAKGLVTQVQQQWGHIDALINGAGPYHRVNLFEESVDGWNQMFDGNLHPVFYLAQAVSPGMKARKSGRIISFSMANADQMISQPDVTAHYIAKAGVLILTRTLAKLLAPHGITVNAISPGFIDSGSAPPGELASMTKRIPAGYVGTVDDTVAAVRYLLSDEARYVNGANIQISGAWGI